MTPEKKAEYRKLAEEVMEPVLTVAAKRLEQAIEEIYATQIAPLRKANRGMLAALKEATHFVEATGSADAIKRHRAAIAQAKAAGITLTSIDR